jgi:hypothetical protein
MAEAALGWHGAVSIGGRGWPGGGRGGQVAGSLANPFRQFIWRAEGGDAIRKCLTGALFWHSATNLPWRNGVSLVLEGLRELEFGSVASSEIRSTKSETNPKH